MDQATSKIVHFHVVCNAETEGKSNLMEKQGLICVLKKIDKMKVSVKSVTTDKHTQIRKYLREETDSVINLMFGMLQSLLEKNLRKQPKKQKTVT